MNSRQYLAKLGWPSAPVTVSVSDAIRDLGEPIEQRRLGRAADDPKRFRHRITFALEDGELELTGLADEPLAPRSLEETVIVRLPSVKLPGEHVDQSAPNPGDGLFG